MIVRSLEEIKGTDRDVDGGNWVSRRLLLAGDNMGFSLHDTILKAGTTTPIHYQNHLEAVYCIEGHVTVELDPSGEKYEIKPGTVYALDKHDKHVLIAHEDTRVVCVFNPAVTGTEVHNKDGVYPVAND
ncbi:L-ectoine synthase [Blastopirellula marina]|uniref:L-ectoine synthase n=1 Tax=Blastopirellula marina TaxID=124 RepID=A0A2S8G8P8_9BACT|nr:MULTISPECIES: ectoine synthase [Pirellulaceae]PQO40803.1 L-ectoine synthase [Blastopirellula marina]RCS56130.1 ectoine synthase [Bremerella cremea]